MRETLATEREAEVEEAGRRGGRGGRLMLELLQRPWVRALAPLVLVLIIGFIFNAHGAFYAWGTHRDMLRQVSVGGILACGLTLVIITGGIDLSVGSLLGFSAVLFSLLAIHQAWPALAAIAVVLAAGGACGLVSGELVARFKMQPFIATLAMMVFGRGLAKSISGGEKVSQAVLMPDGQPKYLDLPRIFSTIDSKVLGGHLTVVSIIFFVCVAACWVLLGKLRWGRYLYATGGNEDSARLSGIPTHGVKLLAYGLSGLLSAVAGICQAAQEQQGDPEAGERLRADRHRHRGHGRHQPERRPGRDALHARGRRHHRLSREDPQHQRRARGEPPHAHRRHRRRSRAVPEGAEVEAADGEQTQRRGVP